ncbi:MAG TPA: MtrB/PioB family outer membrane beta-barrel protein [Geobacteraceae bacterium]|nr:MtrB/PioB family outer membrane beta-barrel protein [Geobacteraceae bacterium]
MRQKTMMIIGAVLLGVALICPAQAAEDRNFEGEVSVGGVLADINGSEAKFNEYRNVNDSLTTMFDLKYDNNRYYLKLDGDISRETNFGLTGGLWGGFSYYLRYQEIPHNITFGARTYYLEGVGGDELGGIVSGPVPGTPTTDVTAWKGFDYSTERKRYSAGFRLDALKPFFVSASFSREDKSGIKPAGASGGFSVTSEIPEPIDYRTDSFGIEAGYAKKPFFASLSYFYSTFDNDSSRLDFTNAFSGSPDALSLPPDNDYYKIAFKASAFLPLNSRLSLNVGSSRTRADSVRLWDAFTLAPTGQSFNGRVETTNYDLALTSSPLPWLDAKVYAGYYDKDNRSDVIDDGEVNELFDYTRRNEGLELGVKLPMHFYLSGSYKNNEMRFHNRIDVTETTDDIYAVNLRWSGLDFLTLRTGYERVNRQMDRAVQDDPDEAAVESFIRRYDVAPMHRDSFKASVDISPLDSLNISLGYIYKRTDYYDTTLGLTEDKRDEFTVDADYSIGTVAKLYGYFDYEKVRSQQDQRQFTNPSTINPDGAVQDPLNFNWNLHQKDKTYDFGVGTDIYIIPKKLTLKLQYDYVMSNGDADFQYLLDTALTGGRTNSSIDAGNWDDYRKQSFRARAVYDLMKSMSITAGYAYEKFRYDDLRTDDYQYVVSSFGFANTFLSGAYKDQDYTANVFFLGLTYRF